MESEAVVSFGDWLTAELGRRDWSARLFGRRVGVSGQTVTKWINGAARPRRAHIPKIAEALGMHDTAVWEALRELPDPPYSDITLSRLLELPQDLSVDEILLMRHLFRAVRAYERERGERGGFERQDAR